MKHLYIIACLALLASCSSERPTRPHINGSQGATGDAKSNTDANSPTAGAAIVPFEALTAPTYVKKVKTILTGATATSDEITAVSKDNTALKGLVASWMKQSLYISIMQKFFADSFQQSQVQPYEYDDESRLIRNIRESFARTVTQLIAEGRPFTEVATTRRYMMTTAMIFEMTYRDSYIYTDNVGERSYRPYKKDHTFNFTLTRKEQIPLADSGNPASPNYLKFYIADMATMFVEKDNNGTSAICNGIDTFVVNEQTSFALGDNIGIWLRNALLGYQIFIFDGPQGSGNPHWCTSHEHGPSVLTDADYNDWRMVTITSASDANPETRFFDIAGNRKATTISMYQPAVGFFTTPAFMAQYNTNKSNQARGIATQTMIVGLGQTFTSTPAASMISTTSPGIDLAHASRSACFACHWNLDPMARFFRSTYSLNWSEQTLADQLKIGGTFLFGTVTGKGSNLYDLGANIAAHPSFKTAWTQKLCSWANSNVCSETDPEFIRIANAFAADNYNWNTLVTELFSSPIVTFAKSTASAQTNGTPVPITRHDQMCNILSSRLGIDDIYALKLIGDEIKDKTIPDQADQLPKDQYVRGQTNGIFINAPDPFYRGAVEKVCALAADKVVDIQASGTAVTFQSTDVTSAIAAIVHTLMGVTKDQDAQPIDILTRHYNAAKASGLDATTSLKSTFILGCIAPNVVSIGQ